MTVMDRVTPDKLAGSGGSGGPEQLTEQVLVLGRRAGLDAVGVAPADPFLPTRRVLQERKEEGLHGGMHFTYGDPVRATDPARSLAGATALLVGAVSYRRQDPEAPPAPALGQGARYSWNDSYAPLREALAAVAGFLDGEGWRATVLVDDNGLVDREAAYRAGLGWYGKNTNLLMPGRGSWFVLGSVVTDAPLTPSAAPAADGCGPCRQCLPACPTGALVGPGVLDARRCLAWLLEAPGSFPPEYRGALGGRIYGCDDCQTVCPPNRANDLRHPPPPAEPGAEAWVDLVELLGAGDEELLERFGRWYIPRRQPRYLRRNALIALGNVGDGNHPDVARVLARYLSGADPMLREHASWAVDRLRRRALIEAGANLPLERR
ncbi:MAG TPA: tRNA epoxyqueuosine(34) reductase QueG [Acidimicrobiales bacterium]|nr:tRNA epoxyqueuosine(34) reductase QueG [Acidimicrobiales bacterium]